MQLDRLRQHKSKLDFFLVIQKQETETTPGTDSPKLDGLRVERCRLVGSNLGSEFGMNSMNPRPNLPCVISPGCCWCNGVENVFLAHAAPLNTIRASFDTQQHIVVDFVPLLIATIYPSPNSYFMMMRHVANWSQTGSACCKRLPSDPDPNRYERLYHAGESETGSMNQQLAPVT